MTSSETPQDVFVLVKGSQVCREPWATSVPGSKFLERGNFLKCLSCIIMLLAHPLKTAETLPLKKKTQYTPPKKYIIVIYNLHLTFFPPLLAQTLQIVTLLRKDVLTMTVKCSCPTQQS